MSDLLAIGSSGISAYQRALATVSNNIANVNTDGYTRQDVAITSNQPIQKGNGYIGSGARFDAVRRQFDAFIESNLRNSNSDLQAQEPLLSYVNRLIDIMGDQSIGLTTAMNQFFESARTVAADPASTIARSIFLRDADGLAARYRELAAQMGLLQNETQQSVETDIGQINAYTTQLAQINKQLTKHSEEDRQPSELLDQRDMLLRELSDLVSIRTSFAPNGSVLVSVGDTINQGILVQGSNNRLLSVHASQVDANKLEFVLDAYGDPEGVPAFASGKISGIVQFREQVLNPALDALDGLASVTVEAINAVHMVGLDSEGKLGGALFGFTAGKEDTAAGVQLLIRDASRVAAAGQFRVIDNPLNSSLAEASVSYTSPVYEGATALLSDLAWAQTPSFATLDNLSIQASMGYTSLGVAPFGTTDLTLTLSNASASQSFQVLTRDGRHLAGTPASMNDGELAGWASKVLDPSLGMELGATYDNSMLNQTGNDAYLNMDIFIGVKAEPVAEQRFNQDNGNLLEPVYLPATVSGAALDWPIGGFAEGTFTLNGQSIANVATINDLVNWINLKAGQTGVNASLGADNRLTLTATNNTGDIRLGLGSGTSADLTRLGFDTSLYVSGATPDDLLIYVTDTGPNDSTVNISGQYNALDGSMKQALRESQLQITFLTNTTYEIRDLATDTVVAERTLDTSSPTPSFSYRGLNLQFSNLPGAGDVFVIDGNQDGIGNNEVMLQLVALEDAEIMPGGLTLTEAYIERVNLVGNVARQAAISQQALEVVYQQALETRDGISGVNLDQEASALVRFQQAYQANAKVMQLANTLFDTILQVR
jgi:flagellar hook-associated protein 1 FlgK